ncbi:clotting factor C-like [Liolophura sinensis]|uniref:clotting factor C-like n=1 Tax=Liolophura sinensis TaxID=3198878 RepID=UPI0031585633
MRNMQKMAATVTVELARRLCVLIVVTGVTSNVVLRVASTECDDNVISCPCGTDGRNTVVTVKMCFNVSAGCLPCDGPYTSQSICEQFRYCKTCHNSKDGGCESCPQGRHGKRCLNEQTCGRPPPLENGFYEGSDWEEEDRVRYYCKYQWILSGDSELVCQNGRWTGKIPTCIKGCGPPPDIPNGHYDGSNWTNGGRVRYICKTGRSLIGDPELICDGSRWIGVVPSCGKH